MRYITRLTGSSRGFTLIEIMTAVSIFAIITTISMGSILTVFDLNRKAESVKIVMDNLNLALDSMAREIRFGYRYHCDPSLPINLNPSTGSGPDICNSPESSFAFYIGLPQGSIPTFPGDPPRPANLLAGRTVVYRKPDGANYIEKSTDGGSNFTRVTAPEIIVESLDFYVLGAMSSSFELSQGQPAQQPKVLIKIKGRAGVEGSPEDTEFVVQTLVSQRRWDI